MPISVSPFTLAVPEAVLADLRRRLAELFVEDVRSFFPPLRDEISAKR